MIKFVYGILPAFVHYTDDIRPDRGGTTQRATIKIRPAYAGDRGLLEHELEHVRQYYKGLLPWSHMTHLEKEVAAYKHQLKFYPDDRADDFAERLTRYEDFTLTQAEAFVLLRG